MRAKQVVAALHYERVRQWCRTHNIDPKSVLYISGSEKLLDLGDYHLVLLDHWERNPVFRDDSASTLQLLKFALDTHYQWDVPIVEAGRIAGWQ